MTTAWGIEGQAGERVSVPGFVPHPLLWNGHLQTVIGRYMLGRTPRLPSVYHEVSVGDGDRLSVLDSVPDGWDVGRPAAVMVHGLGGCARSSYVVRIAAKLWRRGVRVVRMNLRGAGSGFGLARGTYHAGLTGDLRAVMNWLAGRAEGSPIALVGFSLGANLVLKLAAEAADEPLAGFDCVLAANPPIDLAECCRSMTRPTNRVYDRKFARQLRADVERLHAFFPDLGPARVDEVRTVLDFDEQYTAPRHGFADSADYYARSSAAASIPRIRAEGLVVHAEDDPFIPVGPFRRLAFPPGLALELIPGGGHLGYISRTTWDGDRRWLDARLIAWLDARWGLSGSGPASPRSSGSRPSERESTTEA